jgi:hypothetical protein
VSDADTPKALAGIGAAGSLVERAATPVIDELRAVQARAAETLARMLRDGALSEPLTPKPLAKLATELVESLSDGAGDAD